MPVQQVPYRADLDLLGVVEGVSYIDSSPSLPNDARPYPQNLTPKVLCHFLGGIPYALPPVGPYRFKRPRALPACYRYGTHANPGRFVGGCGLCPQPDSDLESWEEDCLQLNMWIPAGEVPKGGWPILFFIHGGFLQWGSPNGNNPTELLGETSFDAIIIMPAYRLNALGFLASRELAAESPAAPDLNVGLWDQRLALEWTYKKISYFGGDADRITVAGYSAGAYSTFHQLAHDLYHPSGRPIVKRAIMWSNGPGVHPHSLAERQQQFDQLLGELRMEPSLPAADKMAALRRTPARDLVAAAGCIPLHEFRATTDGAFISDELFARLRSGDFARRMRDRGVRIIAGECRDERHVYGAWRRPRDLTTREAVEQRLRADYPAATARALSDVLLAPAPGKVLPAGCADWAEAFGRAYSFAQVYGPQRGLVIELSRRGEEQLVLRYRIEWRARCADASYPREWGVCHGSDMPVWFFGNGVGSSGLEPGAKEKVRRFATDLLAAFVRGEDVAEAWGTRGDVKNMRRFRADGEVDVWRDDMWEQGVAGWDALAKAGCLGRLPAKEEAKL